MASKIPGVNGSVQLNRAGMRELLKSREIQFGLVLRMTRVQSALPGSILEATEGRTRARVKVARGSDFDEANTGDLSRALDLAGATRGRRVKSPKARRKNSG